jgi:hypothetical protein
MQVLQVIKPVEGLNVDTSPELIKQTECRYALNIERTINNQNSGMGKNAVASTPSPANVLLDYAQPEGVNTKIGSCVSRKTNEIYVFVHNSLNNHHIYRINGNTNTIQMVLLDPLLNFSLHPRHQIHFRAHLYYVNQPVRNGLHLKYLLWTEGLNWQGFLDVETSITTNGFRVPYFDCDDRTQLWQLATRPSLECISGDFDINNNPEMTNRIANNMWQFRIKYIYTDGRPTAWGPIPTSWVFLAACQKEGLFDPRCINLRIPVGGPHVEKIILAYRNCVGAETTDAANDSDWSQTDIINKYEDCLGSDVLFYHRRINPSLNYDGATNTILYQFCNEGTCIPISKEETDLNFIPIPKTSYALMPIEDKVALLNNVEGDDPIDCRIASMFSFNPALVPSQQSAQELITVKVSIIIHQLFRGNNNGIFVYEDAANNNPDSMEGLRKFFGGLSKRQGPFGVTPFDDPGPYDQYFEDVSKDAGFIVYVEGSEAFAVSKQYRAFGGVIGTDPFNEKNFSSRSHRKTIGNDLQDNDYYFISVAELKVIKGTKGFIRMASPLATTSQDFRNTSANVWGVLLDLNSYHSNMDLHQGNTNLLKKEIPFNTCGMTGDTLDLTGTPFVIADLTAPYGDIGEGRAATAITGYARDGLDRPVSKAAISHFGSSFQNFTGTFTDHNGYYFWTADFPDVMLFPPNSGIELYIEGPNPSTGGCQQVLGGSYRITGAPRPNQAIRTNILVGDDEYENNYLQPINVKVVDSNGVPIAGVPVAASRSKTATTNSQGIAVFNLRRYMPFYPSPESVQFVLMQSTGCLMINDAEPGCMPDFSQALPACFRDATLIERTFSQMRSVAGEYGYAPGGVYPLAFKLIDAAGRETFAEKITTLTLPEMQQVGQFGLFQINWQFNGSANFPREYVKMAILIGANSAWDDYVTWVADDVKYVDSAGVTATPTNADKVLISIQSLYDNQLFYGQNNTARYQFVPGDRVQIVTDKDGNLYDQVYDYLIESDYNNRDQVLEMGEEKYSSLVITFDKALENFGKGSQIKIYRPSKCKSQEFFYECCDLIDLVDGEPVVTRGQLGGFDAYMIRRGIRYDDQTNSFGFPFLHHSPSDHWGDHCLSRGRVSITNPYSRRLRYERNMKISGAFLQTGYFNGLNVFSRSLQKNFSGEQRGGIIAAISQEKVFMVICEFDNFTAQTADQFVTVNARSGQLQALPGDAVVSDAESKIIGNFGCQYDDVGSLAIGNGWVAWIDTYNKAPVLHNWNVAKDASLQRMQGYFVEKLTHVYSFNQTALPENKIRVEGCYDSINGNVLFTFFNPKGPYVHSRHDYSIPDSETIAMSVLDNTFPTMYGFTPEGYSTYDNSIAGDLFIAFKNGKPWLHRVLGVTQYNTFFGETSDMVFEPILNEKPEKVKILLAMQQLTKHKFYVDRIITSVGHESRLPPAWVKQFTEGKYDASFLMAENRKGGLFNGPALRGHWIQIRFVRDNTVDNIISELDPGKQAKYSMLDKVLIKCAASEQSAYNT